MMNYSINIQYIAKTMPMEHAAQLVSEAGFTALDYTPLITDDNWEATMATHLQIFADNHLHVHQTHAPFNRYNHFGDKHKLLVERTLKAAKEMNAAYMVVHGDEFDFRTMEYTPEKALAYNYDYFAPFVEKAIALDIGIAFENVFEDANRPRFCSDVTELKALIEKFNSPNVSCCWDFGHANVAFSKEHPDKLATIVDLVRCTHIHDNYYGKDLHLPPFFGEIDWNKCMQILGNAGYKGNLSFEFVYGAIPEALAKDYLMNYYNTAVCLHEMM